MENETTDQLVEVCNVYGIDLTLVKRGIDEYITIKDMNRHYQDFLKVYRKAKKTAVPIKLKDGTKAIVVPNMDMMIVYRIVMVPPSTVIDDV